MISRISNSKVYNGIEQRAQGPVGQLSYTQTQLLTNTHSGKVQLFEDGNYLSKFEHQLERTLVRLAQFHYPKHYPTILFS